jgi:Replication protein
MAKPQITVNGNGTELYNGMALKGRAKRKMITQNLTLNLIDIAERKGEDETVKSFWNTYYCQSRIYSSGNRLYGKYCKNRFCTLCCSIRKAFVINKYLPAIKLWEDPYFITLTMKAVPAKLLKQRLKNTLLAFRIIINRYRKKNQRGKGIKLMGIKSLECNFNLKRKTYNPHLHLIVANKKMADVFIGEWLKLWTAEWAYKGAQDARKVEDTERALIEIVKYGSKIFTEPDANKKSKEKNSPLLYVSALSNILKAMKGVRVFERFGFNISAQGGSSPGKTTVLNEYKEWEFDLKQADWINTDSGKVLSGYLAPDKLKGLLDNNIDKKLE